MTDPRRFIPRVDEILASQAVKNARAHLAEHVIRARINQVLAAARAGEIAPQAVKDEVEASLIDATPYSLHPVLAVSLTLHLPTDGVLFCFVSGTAVIPSWPFRSPPTFQSIAPFYRWS